MPFTSETSKAALDKRWGAKSIEATDEPGPKVKADGTSEMQPEWQARLWAWEQTLTGRELECARREEALNKREQAQEAREAKMREYLVGLAALFD